MMDGVGHLCSMLLKWILRLHITLAFEICLYLAFFMLYTLRWHKKKDWNIHCTFFRSESSFSGIQKAAAAAAAYRLFSAQGVSRFANAPAIIWEIDGRSGQEPFSSLLKYKCLERTRSTINRVTAAAAVQDSSHLDMTTLIVLISFFYSFTY